MKLDFAETMRRRSSEELRRVCSVEAGDYAPEAIEAARAELVRRGEDVSGLVSAKPEERVADPGGWVALAALLTFAVGLPLIAWGSQMPRWLHLAGWAVLITAFGFLRLVGVIGRRRR